MLYTLVADSDTIISGFKKVRVKANNKVNVIYSKILQLVMYII